MEFDKIYNEDCIATLSRMQNDSIDLIITSPPYNKNFYCSSRGQSTSWRALRGAQIPYDVFTDSLPPEEYESWQREIIQECLRVLKPTGSLFYNHKDIISKGQIVVPKYIYDFPVHQQIIWNRGSCLDNNKRYFQPITEYIYWLVKDSKQFFFDKSQAVYKQSVWNINFEINTDHPAPFPKVLVGNIIKSCSKINDVVYDPFMGSGTVALVAKRLGRYYIGSEISENYVNMANKRLMQDKIQPALFNLF